MFQISPKLLQGNKKWGLEHIVRRHWHSSGVTGTSKFGKDIGLKELRDIVNQAASSSASWHAVGSSYVLEATLSRIVGQIPTGQFTNRMRIVTDQTGRVITAYPIP